MNNDKSVDFSKATLFLDGKEIGKIDNITTEADFSDYKDSTAVNNVLLNKSYEGSFKVDYIDENVFELLNLRSQIKFYSDVFMYAKHSKKRERAFNKLYQLWHDYMELSDDE